MTPTTYLTPKTPAERIATRVADLERAIASELDAADVAARREVCENAIVRATRADVTLAPLALYTADRLSLDLEAAFERVEAFDRVAI